MHAMSGTRTNACPTCPGRNRQAAAYSSNKFYMCEPCNFTVHTHCATAPAVLEHSLFVGSRFTLIEDQTTQNGYMNCQACGGETVGFRYFNAEPYLYLHPCCAVLPTRVVEDGRVFQLLKDSTVKCGICKDKSQSSFSYCTSNDDGEHLSLHVPCLVRSHTRVTGYPNWQPSAPIVEGVLGTFTASSTTTRATSSGVSYTASASSSSSSSSSWSSTGDNILKAAKVSSSAARLVLHVATFDFGGAAEAIQDIAEAFE